MDRIKPYDYSASKIFQTTAHKNQTTDQILRQIFIDPLISPIDKQSAELYQAKTYEERLEQAASSVYGIRLSYPKLLALYTTFKVPKERQKPVMEIQIE